MQQDGKVTPSKERKSIATNVLRNPAAKVAVASTLVGSIGIAGGLEVFLPGEEQQKVEAAVHGDFEYIISNGAVTITGYTGASYLHPVIPSYIGGYPVRVIGESAFEEDYLGQVTIPNTVTTIESRAFYSSALDAINIPSSVTTIGEYAFHGNLLKSLTIPSSVKTIGMFAFASNNIQNLTIPGTLKVVGAFTFYNNEMKTLTISSGVTDIEMYAFNYNQLTQVTIPSTVKTVQDGAFSSNKIATANIPSAATTLGEGVFEYNQDVSTNLNITGADPSPAKMYALNNAHKFNGKILDVTPPSIILTPNKTEMTNENITVSANITDSASAVSVKKWAAGNQSVGYFASNGTVLDSSFVATSNGTYTVYAKDAAGNEAVQTITINNIDRVAPIPATFSPSTTAPTKEDISLTINYPNDSAIKQYSINDGTWETYSGPLTISNNVTVKARSMDSANNTSEESSISITNIDRVAPNAPTLSASTTAPTNGQVEITITYPEDTTTKQYSLNGGAWENYTNPIVMTSNGTVKARGIDAAGNISNENSIDVSNIDDVPPANATFHASSLEPTNEDVTVTITYPEDALLKEYKLGTGGTWTTYTNPIVLSSNTIVYARSKDEASNYSKETSLAINNIDKTPPANATFTLSNDQPTNNNVSVTIDYPNDSTVKQFKVGEDGVWTNYTIPVILSENNTIFARSQDAVGNWSNETNFVITNIDKIAPTKPTITADKSTTTNLDVKVSITYSSDIKVKEYRLNGGEWLTYSGPITILENKLVEARGQDAAGNTSEIASIEINNIDKVKPEITLTPTSINPVNTEIEIDVKIIDNNPIIEKKWAKGNQDESYFLKAGTNITDNTFNVSENGTYTVYAKDSAGNVSLKTIDISNIDKEAPVIKLTPSTNTPINTEMNVNVEVTDNNQIIEKKWAIGNQNKSYFSKSGTNLEGNTFSVKENGTYTVYAKDSAGNETIQTISISNIDKEGPVITLTPSTIDPINTEINVDIKLEDNNPILIKKWAKGNQNVSFFSAGGTDVSNNKFTVTENDIYTVYAKDSAGNETVQTIDITNIDMVAPKAPILEVSSTATTNMDVTVTISYPADVVVKEYKIGSGDWQPYVGQIVIENNETVYARGKDEAGNWSVESSIDVTNIDKEAPGEPTFSVSTNQITNQNVTVKINYPNDPEIKQYKIGTNGDWINYSEAVIMTTNDTIFARSQDLAGNWSAETNLVINNIDKVAPETPSITTDNSSATNGDVKVTITYPGDAHVKEYRIDEGTWIAYSGPITVSENTKVEAKATDAAGNDSDIASIEIDNIDKTKPEITLTPSRLDPVNTEIDVDVEVIDNNPIIEKKWAKGNQNEGFFATGGTDISGESFIVSENGVYTVYAKDSAGNISIKTIDITNIDMEAPVITLTPSKINPTNTEITVDVEASDNVKVIERKWVAGDQPVSYFMTGGTVLTGNSFIVSKNGIYTVYVKDSAGNETVQTINISNIDMEAPVITLTPSRIDAINTEIDVDVDVNDHNAIVIQKWAKGNVDLSFFHANGTEIKNRKFIVGENGVYTVYAKDSAGNESLQTITISNIDKEAPVITLTPSKIDPVNTEIDVDIEVVDHNPIVEKKWAKGSVDESYFATNGTDITGDSFLVSENGVYTVYAKDSAGNISLKTINITNIDFEAPVITLTPSKIDPTNTEIDVDVDVDAADNVKVIERKWAVGDQAVSFFEKDGTVLTGNSFIVSKNGTYSVYARDSAGNETVQTINITNIDVEAPVITLTPSKIDAVNTEIDVDVDVTDHNAIISQKWAKGDQVLSYFQSNGLEIVKGKFIVSENGIYTVYAKDSAGNESIQTITISNIDMDAPVITLTPSKIDPVNTEIDVDVTVVDNNPIVTKKWAAGNKDSAYFQTGGKEVVNDKFIVSENGIYTVYAKDSAGNETLQTIEINNIDMDVPDVALLKASTTDPTNKAVTVTITYPDDVTVKEYKIGSGTWTTYEGPITISNNDTVYARGKDAAGNWSEVTSLIISNIDKTAPGISFSGITNGQTYVNQVTPLVSVEDLNKFTTSILLNGEAYDGSPVTESGSYVLTVKAVDEAGNESIQTIAFHVNHSPEVVGSITDKKWKKFEEETIDLSTIFKDKEDTLTYSVTSSDEKSVSALVKDGTLHIKALKQGTATISIIAHDGFSDSEMITFKVEVNSAAPTISIINDQMWITADGEKFTLEGIVTDKDKEEVTITATINGVKKSVTILTTGEEDTWSIEFDGTDLAVGIHTVSIQAKDQFDGSAEIVSSKYIVKVPVTLKDYEPIISTYESDIVKDRQDFSETEHKVLLDAFIAVESLKTTNNPDAWLTVKPKVDLLAEGTVKTEFYKAISGNALDYLIDNLDTATKTDYETAGLTNVQENLVPTYNEKNAYYLAEKGELTGKDIQLIIDIVNAVDKANASNLVEDWNAAKTEIEKLADGALKNEYLQVVEDGFIKAIEVNPDELTVDLIGKELGITANQEHQVDYQMYLQDELAVDPILTKERLESIIQTVDKLYDLIDSFMEQPTQENLTAFENAVVALTDGNYQSKNEGFLPGLNLEMVVNDPKAMTEDALNTIGITHDVSHIPLYQDFLTDYLVDVSKGDITKEILQQIIHVVDAIEKVKENPTDENIQDLLDLIGGLNPDASVIDKILDDVGGSILDKINDDFSNVTEKQLENIGIDNVDGTRMPEYQDALNEYAKEKDPTDLTHEDIQKIIDAVNGVENAKANPSEDTIRNGYDAVNKLDDGPLKDKLLQELEDITVDYIAKNPDKITQELLDYANLDTDPELIDSYKDYLQDVLPGLSEEITKEKLQELIDQVNEVWAAYHEAMTNPSKENVLAFETLANALVDGVFKTKMVGLVDDVALAYLKASPSTQEADDYARMGVTIVEENLSSYNTNMEKYIKDLGTEKFSLTEVQQVIAVTNRVETALADSKTANVQQALSEIKNLENGKLKTDLNAALNGQVIGDINLNPSTVTADDLINLGKENVNPDYEKLYQDALTKLKDDLGGTLTFEDVQNAVDSVNAVEKALVTGNNQDILDAFEEIKQLPDGSLKDYLTEKLQEEVVKEIIENPENITTEHLGNGGFIKVDPSLEEEYKDALTGYEEPLTKEAVQQIIDVVNQVKKTRLDLTQNDVNTLSNMVDRLAESETKENLVKVKDALRALLDAEQYMNVDNLRKAYDKIALVETRENAYLKQMATSLSQVRSALVDPSDETVGMAQAELIKLDSGQLKDLMQSRIGGAYLEHVITNPGSSQHSDWINAGFENVIEDNLPLYNDAVNSITNEVGQLTKEQIQAIIDAINAIKKAKENPTNQTIQNARDAINKVVESQQKKNWLAEMDALWQSIQPKPKPTPNPIPDQVKPPVVKQEPLPLPSDRVMVVSNEYASVVMTIPKIEVSETDSLKVKIKVSAKDILEGSKLYLYSNFNSLRGVSGTAVASTNPKYLNRVGQQGHVLEIDFGKLEKGTIEVERDLVFDENGEYLIKGVFVANGANLETNTVKVSVYKELLIPNTVLPNQHGLPVATLKANQDIALYKKDENGNFVRVSGAKAGNLHQVYDTEKGFYKLADGFFIHPSARVTVHIGKGEIRKVEVNVHDKNGRFIRTIKKGQQYKVYSYDNKRYAIGGGEYIEVQEGVTYVFGWITVKEPMTLYKPDGTAERTLKAGEKYRVYRADKDYLHLGGGYTVKRDNSKYDFLKN